MKRFLIALQFLTIIPLSKETKITDEDLGKSTLFFPIIGILIGGLLSSLAWLLLPLLPIQIVACLILILSAIITGGIHLDGFIDSLDGLYGIRSLEKRLLIMRDSCSGAIGVIGISLLLLFKFSLLISMPTAQLLKSVFLMPIFARWIQVMACFLFDYVREEGKGKSFIAFTTKFEFLVSTAITIAICLLLYQLKGIIIFSLSLVPSSLFLIYVYKKIGGMTGDTIGAASEIAETAVLFSFLIMF